MLEKPSKRPETATTVYIPDANMNIIEQQLRAMDPSLEDAFANTNASISLQEPTKSRLAAWVLYLPQFCCDKGLINLLASKISSNLGGSKARIVEIDMGLQSVAISIEDYEPSAYAKQLSYTVADLPE